MLSQIQPHFLYNTLGAIQELCDSDPELAGEATAKFTRYLQGNMMSLNESGAFDALGILTCSGTASL